MLSDAAIRQINREIESEMRYYSMRDHEEQMRILERVAKLKSILDPAPTAAEIAAALKTPELPNDLSADFKKIFDAFRR